MKVLAISLDTVSAQRLSSLGSNQVATPNIDALASEGALFTQAYTTDIPTQPSHTALFTGRYGASSGIVAHFHPPAMLPGELAWLPSLLHDQGCRTGAVDHLFSMKKWFINGYDDYMVPPGRSRSPASVINDLAFPWLTEHAREDFFCFLHYWDAHIPYVPPEPYKTWYTSKSAKWSDPLIHEKLRARPTYPLFKQNLYDHLEEVYNLDYVADLHYAEVAYLDAELGRLFDHLDSLGVLDDVMVVLFGDHGEVMTEHDSWFDHAGLYDCVVHVPLVIRARGKVPSIRVDEMVALVDVFPTVLDLLELEPVEACDGRSLVPLIRREVEHHRDFIPLSECTWQAKRGLRTDRWKYIRNYDPGVYGRNHDELYDLLLDPGEQTNVAEDYPDVVRELSDQLDGWLAGALDGGPDAMAEVIEYGLPGVERLNDLLADSVSPQTGTESL